ncbi:MAG: hypothetical protein ACLR67_00460 [Eggerthella lenta]
MAIHKTPTTRVLCPWPWAPLWAARRRDRGSPAQLRSDTGLASNQDDLLNLVGTDEAKKKDFRSDITGQAHAGRGARPAERGARGASAVEILSSKERDPEVFRRGRGHHGGDGTIDYAHLR